MTAAAVLFLILSQSMAVVGSPPESDLARAARVGAAAPAGAWIDRLVEAKIGSVAPPLSISSWYNSEPLLADSLRGHRLILSFWDVTCGSCPPALEKLARIVKGRSDYAVVCIHFASQAGMLPDYLRTSGFALPVGVDTGDTKASYGIHASPVFIVVDNNGVIIYKHVRPPTSAELDDFAR